MNSTTSESERELYRGPVSNFTLFIDYSGTLCFMATMLAAYRFFALCKRNNGSLSPRVLLSHQSIRRSSLCLHATLAHISHYTMPAGLTFAAQIAVPWATKLTFLTTAVTTFLCQAYIVRIVGQVVPPLGWYFYFYVACVVLPFLHTAGTSLAGQELAQCTLGRYFMYATTAFSWNTLASPLLFDLAAILAKPYPTAVRRIFKTLSCAVLVLGVTPITIAILRLIYNKPHILVAYAQLTTYEVSGNACPAIVIALMCMPGFGTWEHVADVDEKDRSVKQ